MTLEDRSEEHAARYRELLERLTELKERRERQEQRWIPCSERLPAENEYVFVYLPIGDPCIAWVRKGCWYTGFAFSFELNDKRQKPIAWMPLPEPYKEDKNEVFKADAQK